MRATMAMPGYRQEQAARPVVGVGITLALHVAAIFLLLQLEVVRSALNVAVPITVRLIAPTLRPEPLQTARPLPPKPVRTKPRSERPVPVEPAPAVARPVEPPAPSTAPQLSAAAPEPIAQAEAPVVHAAPQIAPPAPPPPLTPPRFNAAYLNNPPPAYPAIARRMHEEGKVVLRVFVSEQGAPQEVQMRTSSGHARLDEAALEAVRRWRFVPARRGETAVGAWVLVPISFSLRS